MKREDFNRKMYDRVRKMDRCQMQVFFNQVFDSGYAAGVKDMSEEMQVPELIGLEEKLQEIRGIPLISRCNTFTVLQCLRNLRLLLF